MHWLFFFFFSRHYNPWWVLACFTILFHNLLSLHFSLQFLTFIFKSSSTWSSHLSLGLPTGLDEHGSHSVSFLMHWLLFIHKILFSSTGFKPGACRYTAWVRTDCDSQFSLKLCTDRPPGTLIESDSTICCMCTTVSSWRWALEAWNM